MRAVGLAVLALSLAGCYAPDTGQGPLPETTTMPSSAAPNRAPGSCRVASTVDGDTVKLDCKTGRLTVRVIGIDTPETKDPRKPVQCFGPEASKQAAKMLKPHSAVKLLADPSQGDLDKYRRTLGYVILANGIDYGGYMIGHGFAREYTFRKPYQRQSVYRTAQERAKSAHLGLWGACK